MLVRVFPENGSLDPMYSVTIEPDGEIATVDTYGPFADSVTATPATEVPVDDEFPEAIGAYSITFDEPDFGFGEESVDGGSTVLTFFMDAKGILGIKRVTTGSFFCPESSLEQVIRRADSASDLDIVPVLMEVECGEGPAPIIIGPLE